MERQEMTNNHTIDQHLINYKEGLHKFTEGMPEVVQTYNEFTEHCFREGEISKKNKQLIALGISVYSQDEYCMIYHTKGCTDKEIFEAIGVSTAIGGGAAMSQGVTLVQECMDQFKQKRH